GPRSGAPSPGSGARRAPGGGVVADGTAWPKAFGHGREFLAVPSVHRRRGGAECRLAALGARRPALCAREGMGGGAGSLGLGRSFGIDELSLGRGLAVETRPRPDPWPGFG